MLARHERYELMAGRMQPKPTAGDGYLVARAQEGYLDAYEMLVQRHSAMAYRVALRLCGNHHDAQDIAQEALIAACENLARFRAGSSFSTWLYQIVTRRALDKVTRGRGADLADPRGRQPTPAPGPRRKPSVTSPPARSPTPSPCCRSPQRAVVVLHHFEGLSYAEVAEVTRSTVPAVRSHLYRARRTLGMKLQEWR
jgi:RNA polymerase sigma-70 factor (ECF subfamily)